MNHDNALPLKSGAKVSCFGQGSADLLYGGTGSGQVDASKALTLKDALTTAGISVNPELWDFYASEDIKTNYSRIIPDPHTDYVILDDYLRATPMYQVREVPWDMVSNAAIVVLARSGGEGGDLPMGDNGSGIDWISGPDGNYLALTNEELNLLAQLKAQKDAGTFKKIIVLLNSSNAKEAGLGAFPQL